ncbi:MAG: leucine-rich repeat protein [Clostridia bacterium]|nr:leucine-rich repeat protein [Clostridia bacterium]
MKNIGTGAFGGCTSLAKIVFPKSLKHIEKDAFASCPVLVQICFGDGEDEWNAVQKDVNWDKNTGAYNMVYDYKEN